jgi:uncharacterized membrane protein required for colicin V production
MISLIALFWIFIALFAIIGAMRGWAKEVLVSFSVILGIFLIVVLEKLPILSNSITGIGVFWFRSTIIVVLVFFGYHAPNFPRLANSGRFVREHLQDMLLGVFLGAVNGYLIFGTIWYFLAQVDYPFESIISKPDPSSPLGQMLAQMVNYMAPAWLETGQPVQLIFFAVALAFVFVMVVFI